MQPSAQTTFVSLNPILYYYTFFLKSALFFLIGNIFTLLEIGVYEPVSKRAIMTTIKSCSPRVITVCLDIPNNCLKFWNCNRRDEKSTLSLGLTDQ